MCSPRKMYLMGPEKPFPGDYSPFPFILAFNKNYTLGKSCFPTTKQTLLEFDRRQGGIPSYCH